MKKVLIIEDEHLASQRLIRMLKVADPEFEVVKICDSVESSVNFLQNGETPDLILLDIELGDGNSFEIFKQVEVKSAVIFTTAYDEYVFKAFELNSIDYLLKPVNQLDLNKSVEKYKKYHNQLMPDSQLLLSLLTKPQDNYKQRFLVSTGPTLVSINTEDIAYFYSVEKSVFLVSTTGKSYAVEYSLDKLESILSAKDFFRANRQFIIQHKSIKKINVFSKSRIKIEIEPDFSEDIYISNARTHEFRLWLDK